MPYATYPRGTCPLCGRTISNAGFANVQHMRTHVAKGEARELKRPDGTKRFIIDKEERLGVLPWKLAKQVLAGSLTLQQAEEKANQGLTEGAETIVRGGIERHNLPQVPKDKLSEFVLWLRQNEAEVVVSKVSADSIKPIQSQVNQEKVESMKQNVEAFAESPLIVSKGLYLMDGHHRWVVLKELGRRVNVIHVHLPMKELVSLAKEFDDSYSKGIEEVQLRNLVPEKVRQHYRPSEWF